MAAADTVEKAPTIEGDNALFVERDIYESRGLTLDAAFRLSDADIKHVNKVAGSQKAVNYGEMLLSSWTVVLDEVELTDSDVFYDLGSGRGVLTMFTHISVGLKKSVGVELSKTRHDMAMAALSALRAVDQVRAPGLNFLCEDIRKTDLSDATFVFLMNQDMPHKLVAAVWENILQIEHPVTVATLHAPRDVNLCGLKPKCTLSLPQTWNSSGIDLHIFMVPSKQERDSLRLWK